MPKTIIYDPQQSGMNNMFEQESSAFEPWWEVRRHFNAVGYDINTPKNFDGSWKTVEWVIFQNMPPLNEQKGWLKQIWGKETTLSKCRSNNLQKRLCVALYEPPVVKPHNYDEKAHREFSVVFTWDQALIKRGGLYKEFVFIQPSNPITSDGLDFAERKLLCNFSGNKESSHSLELYSERRKFIEFMENASFGEFDHYGKGWSNACSVWRGAAANKTQTMSFYRFNLCYENMKGTSGYVTEKIFDSFIAGSVPIYWGAPNIFDLVPHDAFIDRNAFSSNQELLQYIRNITREEWEKMRQAGANFLKSSAYEKFCPRSVFNMLADGLNIEREA